MLQILKGLEKIADVIIFDSPPALLVADAMVLSTRLDVVILVIQSGKSKWSSVRQTLFDFQKANVNLLGSIINQVPKNNTFAVYETYKHPRESASFVGSLSAAISNGRKPAREAANLIQGLSTAISKRRRPARKATDGVESLTSAGSKRGRPARKTADVVESPTSAISKERKRARETADVVESLSSGEKDQESAGVENEEQELTGSN